MFNKYGERTQPCRTPFLTGNHSDSVPATSTQCACHILPASAVPPKLWVLLLFWHAPLGVRSTICRQHQPLEDGSGPGRLLHSVCGRRLSDHAGQYSTM